MWVPVRQGVWQLPRHDFALAARALFESVWFAAFFCVFNFAVGIGGVFLIRMLGRYVSIYDVSDVTLVVISIAQGVLLRLCWELATRTTK